MSEVGVGQGRSGWERVVRNSDAIERRELLSHEYVECIYVTNILRLRQRAESGAELISSAISLQEI